MKLHDFRRTQDASFDADLCIVGTGPAGLVIAQEFCGTPWRVLLIIYVARGLTPELALQVAQQLSVRDRLGAHLRDELGMDPASRARPLQAAWISATSFASFALVPIVGFVVAPVALGIPLIATLSLASLAALGAFGAYLGGAPLGRAALRVSVGGALAMAVTAAIGRLLGVATG